MTLDFIVINRKLIFGLLHTFITIFPIIFQANVPQNLNCVIIIFTFLCVQNDEFASI